MNRMSPISHLPAMTDNRTHPTATEGHKMRQMIPEAVEEQARQMRAAGETYRAIAHALKISRVIVLEICKRPEQRAQRRATAVAAAEKARRRRIGLDQPRARPGKPHRGGGREQPPAGTRPTIPPQIDCRRAGRRWCEQCRAWVLVAPCPACAARDWQRRQGRQRQEQRQAEDRRQAGSSGTQPTLPATGGVVH
jgi:hypothetical protein